MGSRTNFKRERDSQQRNRDHEKAVYLSYSRTRTVYMDISIDPQKDQLETHSMWGTKTASYTWAQEKFPQDTASMSKCSRRVSVLDDASLTMTALFFYVMSVADYNKQAAQSVAEGCGRRPVVPRPTRGNPTQRRRHID